MPTDYISDATYHINQAKTRVSLFTMVIGNDDSTSAILRALNEAVNRGVKVEVAADIYTYLEHGGMILANKYLSKSSRQVTKMAKEFVKNGVKFIWLGKSHTTVFNGRNHIKWCVVDDIVYSFGGVNLYNYGIACNDYMIKTTSKQLADELIDESKRIIAADTGPFAYPSHSFAVDEDEVLIDGGLIGESIIYRRVCELTREANRVTLVSQFCPTGKLSRLLKITDSKLYFNPPKSTTGLNKFFIKTSILLSGNQSLYTRDQYLHTKLMIFEMKNGQKIAVTGSHNFAYTGVILGTHEIAIQTKNPLIIKQLEDFVAQSIV